MSTVPSQQSQRSRMAGSGPIESDDQNGPQARVRDNWSFGKHEITEINQTNHRLLSKLVKIKDRKPAILSHENQASSVPMSSVSINRTREEKRVHLENVKLVERLEKARGCDTGQNRTRKSSGNTLPPGWTRGIGGQALPPPKLRWGNKKYDAGDWNS